MKDNIEFYVEFIAEVECNPALYHRGLADYNDRRITELIWIKIGKKFNEKGEDCKTKWKSIRSAYIRSLNSQSKKEYYLAPYLQFLNPYIKSKINEVNIPIIQEDEEGERHVMMNPEHKYHIEDTSNNALADEDSYLVPSPPASNICAVDYFVPNKRKKGNFYQKFETQQKDPSELFLLSMVPHVASMSLQQQLTFQRGVLELIDNIKYQQPHSSSHLGRQSEMNDQRGSSGTEDQHV